MAGFFYWIFKISSKHKIISGLLLLGLIVLAIISVSRIKLEENILNLIPHDEDVVRVSNALEGLKINNQLIVHLYYDGDSLLQPDSLIEIAKVLADSISKSAAPFIKGITSHFPDSKIEELYDYYYNNLPFYLEKEDYEKMEERLNPEGINSSLQAFHKSLMSPMGLVTKKMLVKDPMGFTSYPLQRARDFQIADNFTLYNNHILTIDQKHLLFFIELKNPSDETLNNGKLIDELDQLINHFARNEANINFEYFGAAAVAVANARQIKTDIYLTVTLAFIFLFFFISIFYRKFKTFFIVIIPGIFGALMAVAFLVLFRDTISVISLAVGSVLLGITIDYALHLFTHFKQEKNIKQLFEDLSFPTLLCSVTTACAFLSLLFIRSVALQDLGIFAGISVLSASLFTLVVLPHFAVNQKREKSESGNKNPVEKFVIAIAAYPFHKRKWALLTFVIFTAISLFTSRNVIFESNMLKLNYMPDDLAEYESNLNSISTISENNLYIASPGKDIWSAIENNIPLQKELDSLEKEGDIFSFISLNKIIPPRSEQKRKVKAWNEFWEGHNRDSIISKLNSSAVKFGFQENTFKNFGALINQDPEYISEAEAAKIISLIGENLVLKEKSGSINALTTIKLPTENKTEILNKLEDFPGAIILDRGYLTSKLILLMQQDFNTLVNISLLVVFLIILLSYGRIELALIAFAPIILSWLWVLGLMGLFGLAFNIINIIICTFIFGLGIDYSIFSMRGLLQNYSLGLSTQLSYKKSIVLSAVTTVVGIGVLAFAEHPALRSIAFLAIIGILSVIFITFTVQPLIFNFLLGNRKRKSLIPYTFLSLILTAIAFLYFLFGCFVLMLCRILFYIPFAPEKNRKYIFHWILMMFCRTLIYMMANLKKVIIDRPFADFTSASIIISNHHSFIDILILLMFHPKVVMLTNDWTYNSPFFGISLKYADFIPASKGIENQLEKMKELISDGYSIAVFPEGSRSASSNLRRFHKGAFYLAEKLQVDIQPVILHGTSIVMPKGDDFYLKSNRLTIKFLPRIKYNDPAFGQNYSEQTKKISVYFKKEYQQLRKNIESPAFFKEILIKNFIYKGPVLEWYLRVKYKLENSYQLFHELIPSKGRIVDMGCGYGFMSFSLGMSSSERNILAIDYDEKKIEIAKNCPVIPHNVSFVQGDIVRVDAGKADVFIVSDVLHYLLPEEQDLILDKMLANLNENGLLIIRDGDSSKTKRHKGSVLTEVFSTNTGFNKSRNKMNFISRELIEKFARVNDLQLQIIDNTKMTSNIIFVLKRNQ